MTSAALLRGAALSFFLAASLLAPAASRAQLPRSTLAVERDGRWVTWWQSTHAPAAWRDAHPAVQRALAWVPVRDGVAWATLRLRGSGEAWRTRVVVVRLDPRRVRLRLAVGADHRAGRGTWSIDAAPPEAIAAFNAGQFTGASPWGWVVRDGVEQLSPGRGPLALAFTLDDAGAVRWMLPGDDVSDGAPPVTAFQSYPALLVDGEVPAALRSPRGGIDLAHRDARLTLCTTRDGRVLLAMTRFDGLGGVLDAAPFGLTTPEQAALAGALGCRTAMALDGGISAQLLLRDGRGAVQRWEGLRKVPLGVVVLAR